jgi:photosystem II stability/assembly factor-like uncharacterized protein
MRSSLALLIFSLISVVPAFVRAQDFWVPANEGIAGAIVTSFDIDRGGTIYASTAAGIYATDDRGASWHFRSPVIGSMVYSSVLAPNGDLFLSTYDSIYHSSDGGRSWSSRRFPVRAYMGAPPLVGADSRGYLYAENTILIRSSDRGATWDTIAGLTRMEEEFVEASLALPELMLVVTRDGIYISSDSGARWDPVTGPEGGTLQNYTATVVPGGTILLSASGGLYRSDDWAVTWSRVDSLGVLMLHAGADGKIYQIFGSPRGYYSIPGPPSGLRVSSDDGRTWTTTSEGRLTGVIADRSGNLLAARYRTVERSSDGGRSWSPANNGLDNLEMSTIAVGPGGMLATTVWRQPAISSDDGGSWTVTAEDLRGETTLGFLPDGSLIAGPDSNDNYAGRIVRSSNLGRSWTTLHDNLTGAPMIFARGTGNTVLAGTGQNGIFGTGGGSIYRSADGGITWDSIGFGRPVRDIDVKSNGDIFALSYWNTDVGPPFGGGGIHRSTDGGASWTTLNDSVGASAIVIGRDGVIYTDYDIRDRIYLGDSAVDINEHYVLRSTDNGDTWIFSRLEIGGYGMIETLAIDSAGAIYAGTYDQGIYRSTDHGVTWSRFNSGLKNLAIEDIAVTPSGYLIVSTSHNGFYRSRTAQTTRAVPEPAISVESYPNPVMGIVTIGFTTAVDGVVTIELYTSAGEQVAKIFEGRRAAGHHEVRFDTGRLADGVYIYRVRLGDAEGTGRISVIGRE